MFAEAKGVQGAVSCQSGPRGVWNEVLSIPSTLFHHFLLLMEPYMAISPISQK